MTDGPTPIDKDQRNYPRYADRRRVHGLGGDQFEGETRDISGGGASIYVPQIDSPFANDQFVNLHVEGLGERRARVVREVAGTGYALEFEDDEEEKARIAEELAKFHATLKNGLT